MLKGSVPYASPGSGYISVDTSSGSKYSDYTFLFYLSSGFNNFRRIDTKKNFRYYFRAYYDYDVKVNTTIFSKQYSLNKPNNIITAKITLENGISKSVTFNSSISQKSSFHI